MGKTKAGIVSMGAYIPYYFIERKAIGIAWGEKGNKGRRSVANSDEDSVTMSVEAVRDALRGQNARQITHLFNATTTSPYAEKSAAVLISTASNLGDKVQCVDFNSSLRSGLNALKLAIECTENDENALIAVSAADMRNASPKSAEEQLFGDAAAAAIVGTKDVIAEVLSYTCINNEIHDYWRNEFDRVVSTTEARFMAEEGYEVSVSEAIRDLIKKAQLTVENVNKFVISTPDFKSYLKICKRLGIQQAQIQDPLMLEVGCCGCAQPMLLLASALETARPDDIIVVAGYGSGASAFAFHITDKVIAWKQNVVSKFLSRRSELKDYARFLSFRGLLVPKSGEPFKIPAAPSISWREQRTYLRLEASICKKCGCKVFPVSRVCYNCREKDEYIAESQINTRSKLFSFSIDKLAGRSDDPVIVQACADNENGIRFYMNMTDFDEKEVTVGMELDFTFRKIHDLANLPNYYWKFRPVRFYRGEEEK